MKIAVTITDAGMAVNVGGPVESETVIIELRDDQIPRLLRRHLEDRKRVKEAVDRGDKCVRWLYQALSLSFVLEHTHVKPDLAHQQQSDSVPVLADSED